MTNLQKTVAKIIRNKILFTILFFNIIGYAKANVYLYDERNPLDLTPEQKKILKIIKPLYPKTKNLIRNKENRTLINSPFSCRHLDKKKWAIGYGDNYFLKNRPEVKCITNDFAEWLLHWHLANEVILKVRKTDFFKKWGSKLGSDYEASIYSFVYNIGFNAFNKSTAYKLLLKNPFKHQIAIEKEWLKWENTARRKEEITKMHQDPVYLKHFAFYKKLKHKTLNDALKEIGV